MSDTDKDAALRAETDLRASTPISNVYQRNPNLPEAHWELAGVVTGLQTVSINHEVYQALGYLTVGAPSGGVCLSDQAVADVLRALKGAGLEIVRHDEIKRLRDAIRQAHYACTKSSLTTDERLYDATVILARTGINQ